MKIFYFFSVFALVSLHGVAQTLPTDSSTSQALTIETFKLVDAKIDQLHRDGLKRFKVRFFDTFRERPKDPSMYSAAQRLCDSLIAIEQAHPMTETVQPLTFQLILAISKSHTLMLMSERIALQTDTSNVHYMMRIFNAINQRLYALNYYESGHYVYKNPKKTPVKFIHIQSGNDLFRLPGVFGGLANAGALFQRNDDMDYTGSLRIEIGTDYLNTHRNRGLKSYQVLFYGFDVYTPYFKDLSIFSKNDTFNINDRPHGSFQYFGWGKRGLSYGNKYRWAIDVKLGMIGSDIGYRFQKTLHQDISDSPLPRGWGAQVANGGRLGWSLEFQPEWQLNRGIRRRRLYFQTGLDLKLGSQITHSGLMLRLSNKNFASVTQHNIAAYKKNFFNNLYYAAQITGYYVQHNSMLQGYGIFKPLETSTDTLFRISRYRLADNQVRNFTAYGQFTLAYTFNGATLYYQYRIYSPETNLGVTGSYRPSSNDPADVIDLTNRWHRFGVIGLSLNILQHKSTQR